MAYWFIPAALRVVQETEGIDLAAAERATSRMRSPAAEAGTRTADGAARWPTTVG
ncbi:hypothetical protein [Streptomyces sp. NPDC059080]|uniref:hypothetical protein n=1 Tax=Streptomyces sp. NPDC059080 TaxID=3346718 RepID=UPI003688B091